jgi:hypothetical protein
MKGQRGLGAVGVGARGELALGYKGVRIHAPAGAGGAAASGAAAALG